MNITEKDLARFWDKVSVKSTEECWEWTACKLQFGYGRMAVGDTQYLAHRISYAVHVGELLPGMYICHSCDNPACVNPRHLFQGDALLNRLDSDLKGRGITPPHGHGENHPNNKLSNDDVYAIRELAKARVYQKVIGEIFGITQSVVSRIVTKQLWGHLT